MNRIANLLVLLLFISFILPATAIKHVSASTDNDTSVSSGESTDNNNTAPSDHSTTNTDSSSGGSIDNNNNATMSSGESTDNNNNNALSDHSTTNTDSSSGGSIDNNNNATMSSGESTDNNNNAVTSGESTENKTASSDESTGSNNNGDVQQQSNNTGNAADFVNTILEVHNRERAAVGVPPLAWSDKLAAEAKSWAEHLATLGKLVHCGDSPGCDTHDEGENLAGFDPSKGVSSPGQGVQLWVAEKINYHGQPVPYSTKEFEGPPPYPGHYTEMVWRDNKEVGCAASHPSSVAWDILVCRYSPGGNYQGQKPY